MTHKNKIQKYPVDTTCQNLSCLWLRLKSDPEKDAISAGPEYDPTTLHPLTIKALPKNKYQ